jgi:putative spermidine/putrescine transport system permease protein
VRDSRHRRVFEAIFLLPLIVPVIVTALMLYSVYADLRLLGTTTGLVLAHALLAFPYAFLVVAGAVHSLDRRLERAAESMGCPPWQTLRRVTLPLLAPAVAAATLVAAVVSFDEVVATLFLSSPQTRTVPVVMWSFVREEIRPTVAAASAIVMLVNVAVMLLAARLSAQMVKRRTAQAQLATEETA